MLGDQPVARGGGGEGREARIRLVGASSEATDSPGARQAVQPLGDSQNEFDGDP